MNVLDQTGHPEIGPNPPPAPHIAAAAVVFLVFVTAALWLTGWSIAWKVMASSLPVGFLVAFVGQYVRLAALRRRDTRA